MELTVLAVPDCPNAAVLVERLAAALAGCPDAVVLRRQVADEHRRKRGWPARRPS
jgi:hypothetical protein